MKGATSKGAGQAVTSLLRSLAAAALSLGLACVAQAAEPGDPQGAGGTYSREDFPYESLVRQPIAPGAGQMRLTVPLTVDLSKGTAFDTPYWIPASLYVGLTDSFAIGVVHDVYSLGGRRGPIGGLCLGGAAVCARAWDNVGGELALSLARTGAMQVVLDGGIYALGFEDASWDGRVGVGLKLTLGRAALVAKGSVVEALNKRGSSGIKGSVLLAAEGQLQLGRGVALFGRLEFLDSFDVADSASVDAWVPLTVGAVLQPYPRIALGALVRVQNAFGQGATFDARQGQVFLRFHP